MIKKPYPISCEAHKIHACQKTFMQLSSLYGGVNQTKQKKEYEFMNKQVTRKKRRKEYLAALMIATLAIGMFTALFLGVNLRAFAASTTGTERVPLLVDTVEVQAEPILPTGYQTPNLTVLVPDIYHQTRANILSAEEAAELGARYIWEVFGESIDGTYVEMVYAYWPASIRSAWVGMVFSSDPTGRWDDILVVDGHLEYAPQNVMAYYFMFSIDSVTGKRINLFADFSQYVCNDIERFSRDDLLASSVFDIVPTFTTNHIESAEEFASRHFNTSTVVDIQFNDELINPLGFALDEYGNIIATNYILIFNVTDDTGRVAEVWICQQTGELISISTSDNDFIPGFEFIPPPYAVG